MNKQKNYGAASLPTCSVFSAEIGIYGKHRSRNIPPPAATRSAVRAARPEGRPPADSLLCFNMRHANAVVPEKYLIFDMQMRWSRKRFLTLPLNFWTSWQAVILVNCWILWCYRNTRLPSLMKKHGSWQGGFLWWSLVIDWYSMNKQVNAGAFSLPTCSVF